MDYLSSEEYDLMFDGEYEQWLLNQNKKKLKMRDTVYYVAKLLCNGFDLEAVINDFKEEYFEDIQNASESDFNQVVAFYRDMEEEMNDKRRRFLSSCDNNPSESLDEMWSEEVAEFYTDLFFN